MVTSPSASSSDHTSDAAAPRSRRSRVSAEHTLNRVRENQRRHRARQRDHVASLEQKLAETEKLLSEARAEIAALKEAAAASTDSLQQPGPLAINHRVENGARGAGYVEEENTAIQRVPCSAPCSAPSSQQTSLALTVQPGANIDPQLAYPDVPIAGLSFLGDPSFYLPSNASPDTSLLAIPSQDLALIPSNTTAGPPPCCSDLPNSMPSSNSTNDLECSSCKTKPLPDPSESTTLCAQAFVMIGQQNFRNLDPDTIRLWLAQGLRRAQREGEGCRVENGALMRLLDFISGL